MIAPCVWNMWWYYIYVLCSHCTLGRLWMPGRVSSSVMSLLTILCRPIYHIALYVIYTCIFIYGSVHRALRYASYVRCDAYILMTLYMYYIVYDAIRGARCTMVLWHIWRRYVWYIYDICFLLTICHAPHCPPITTPINFLQLALRWCNFKPIVVNTIPSCT